MSSSPSSSVSTQSEPVQAGTTVPSSLPLGSPGEQGGGTDVPAHLDSTSTASGTKPPYIQPTAHEANSIYAIMRQHPRIRLYVKPEYWTKDHLRLLGCIYQQKELPEDTPRLKPQCEDDAQTKAIREMHATPVHRNDDMSTFLFGVYSLQTKISAARTTLRECGMTKLNFSSPTQLQLHFDGLVLDLDAHDIYATDSDQTPALAYLTIDDLKRLRCPIIRRRFFAQFRRNRVEANRPVFNAAENLHRLVAKQLPEDPYIVAVLIALAQHQYRRQEWLRNVTPDAPAAEDPSEFSEPSIAAGPAPPSDEQKKSFPESFKAQVLLAPPDGKRRHCVYSALIPVAFLEKFHQPSKCSPCGPIPITYYSLHPGGRERFAEKLFRAIHAPIE